MALTNADILKRYVADHSGDLARTLRMYAVRMGVADHAGIADDLLSETVSVVLECADRFDPDATPRPWILGIGLNIIRRRYAELQRRDRREPLAGDLETDEEALFDRLQMIGEGMSADDPNFDPDLSTILDSALPDDRRLLETMIATDMNYDLAAVRIGITPGALRVRLHRAIRRIRTRLNITPNRHRSGESTR